MAYTNGQKVEIPAHKTNAALAGVPAGATNVCSSTEGEIIHVATRAREGVKVGDALAQCTNCTFQVVKRP